MRILFFVPANFVWVPNQDFCMMKLYWGVFFVIYAGLCGQIAHNMDVELCVQITHNAYVCNSQKKITLHNVAHEIIIINKIIWMMELHVLAMIGCAGFDMVKHTVEISQG